MVRQSRPKKLASDLGDGDLLFGFCPDDGAHGAVFAACCCSNFGTGRWIDVSAGSCYPARTTNNRRGWIPSCLRGVLHLIESLWLLGERVAAEETSKSANVIIVIVYRLQSALIVSSHLG
jgi:hypothetical protein